MAEAIATTEDDSSIVSENSFVILGQGSLAMELNDGGTETMNSPTFSLTNDENKDNGSINGDLEGDRNSPLPDASSIGIQLKLEKLVKENLLLKETLNQSNLAMKNQFDTLALWHEEVVKTHESHKQKFQETQDQIFKLRNENMKLKELIQHNLERCCENDSTLVDLDLEGANLPLDLVTYKNSKEVYSHNFYIRELKLDNEELKKRLYDTIREKLALEEKFQKALEENANLKKELESKTDLCAECQGSKSLTGDKASNENQNNEKSNQMISLDPEISIINKLSRSVEAELVMTASKQDFIELKKQFEEQSEISLKNSEKLEKMMVLYEEIVAEKNKLKYQLEQSRTFTQELTERIGSLSAELKIKDEQLRRKIDEFELIKKEMQKLVLDCEEVAILRAQVELYQNDFNEERKAREQAISEKEKMAEQVRFLERSLSDFKKRDKENEKKGSTSAPKEKKPTLSYTCPKCMRSLPTLTECESHVEECLNLDMFP